MEIQQESSKLDSEDRELNSDCHPEEKENADQVKNHSANIPCIKSSEKRICEKSLVLNAHKETSSTAENTSQSVGAATLKDDKGITKDIGSKEAKSQPSAESNTLKLGKGNDEKIISTTEIEKHKCEEGYKERSSKDCEEDDTFSSILQNDSVTKIVHYEDNTTILKKTGANEQENTNPSADQTALEKTNIDDGKNAKQTKTEDISIPVQPMLKKSRIILIGKTGTGKSATGNTILGDYKFNTASAFVSCTSRPQKESCICNDHLLEVIDTPGLYDTSKTQEMVKQELAQCIEMCSPGPHVFLVIMSVGRVTEEEKNTLKYMSDLFGGQEFLNHTILIVTRKEDLNPEMDFDDDDEEDFDVSEELAEFIGDSQELTAIVKQCNDRCLAISNSGQIKGPKRRTEAQRMVELIDQLIERNEGNCYSHKMFKELEKQKEILRQEQERRKQDIKKELERKEMERTIETKRRQRNIDELESNIEKEKEKLDKLQWESNDYISEIENKIEELRVDNLKSEQRMKKEFQKLEKRLEELDGENDKLERKIESQMLQINKEKKFQKHEGRLEEMGDEDDILDRKIENQLLQRDKQGKSKCLIM